MDGTAATAATAATALATAVTAAMPTTATTAISFVNHRSYSCSCSGAIISGDGSIHTRASTSLEQHLQAKQRTESGFPPPTGVAAAADATATAQAQKLDGKARQLVRVGGDTTAAARRSLDQLLVLVLLVAMESLQLLGYHCEHPRRRFPYRRVHLCSSCIHTGSNTAISTDGACTISTRG
jgi:hypothetical protein